MRIALFVCLLLIQFLGLYQCLADECSCKEVCLQGKKGDSLSFPAKFASYLNLLHTGIMRSIIFERIQICVQTLIFSLVRLV